MAKPDPSRHAPTEVDEYLAAQKPEFRAKLEQLRSAIHAVAPDCTERVSYRVPIFRLRTDFVALSATKHHCALHNMSKSAPAAMQDTFKAAGIGTSGTTLHFSPSIDLPMPLVESVLHRRLAEVDTG